MSRKKARVSRAAHGAPAADDDEAANSSFVVDTGSTDVPEAPRADSPASDAPASAPASDGGLQLPGHVAIVADAPASPPPAPTADGDYEQIDAAPGARYYEAEAADARRQKGICPVCGEAGHDKKRCPYQQCLACGAIDEHATRDCPLGTSCFRCGGIGHRSRDCPLPRTGGRRSLCERCGSTSHPETSCPTLWRIYTYNTPEEYAERRAKRARHLERRAERKAERAQRREKNRAGWAAALVQPSDSSGPSDSSDDDDDAEHDAPPKDWDPALAWCYNCAASGHHWGDDCFLRRANPTRPTGEPSPFSEAIASSGPFAQPRTHAHIRRGGDVERTASPRAPVRRRRSEGPLLPRPSLLDMERDEDDHDWFARRQALRQPLDYDSPTQERGRTPEVFRRHERRDKERSRSSTPTRARPFALPSHVGGSSEKPVMTRQRTRAAQLAAAAADEKARPAERRAAVPKHSCASDSDEDDRRPRRTSARLGGCAAQSPTRKRRLDDDKENIAPIRRTSRRVLDEEARVRRSPRTTAHESIAMHTRARARHADVRDETYPEGPAAPSLAETKSVDTAEAEAGAGRSEAAAEAVPDAPSEAPGAASSPLAVPRTPSRKRPCLVQTPSSVQSAASLLDDGASEASSAPTTPSTTPVKARAPLSLYAEARAVLRDSSDAPLVGRDTERAALHAFLDGALAAAPVSSGCLYVSGMPGTGKTALVRSVLSEQAPRAQTVLVNCVGLSHPHQVATEILAALGAPRTDDAAHDLERLEAALAAHAARPLVLVLDELDHLLHTHVHQNVLYRLFCVPTRVRSCARVALIGIANSLDLTERFVPLLASRGVQPEQMQFQPLGAAGMCAVVDGRLAQLGAAHGAARLISRPALELLARKLTAVSGDVRRALDTCRQALDMVEAEGAACVQPSHVLRVLSHMAGHAQAARVRSLGIHAKLLLVAWVTLQERAEAQLSGQAPAVDGSVRIADLEVAYHAMLADDAGFASPLETSELLDVLDRLEAQSVIRIYAEATGGSAPQAFKSGARAPGGARRVSPSGKRAAAKQLLGTNRRMVPTMDRASLVQALTTRGVGADEQHTPTVVEALSRLLRRAEDRVLRATLWRAEQPVREHIRAEELGGGRSAVPTLPL